MVLLIYGKFWILKELFFFLIFIDEISCENRSVFWTIDFEGLMMFYYSLDLSL